MDKWQTTCTDTSSITEDNWIVITKAGKVINALIHDEIAKIHTNSNSIEDLLYFNLDKAIAKIDPLLLQFLNPFMDGSFSEWFACAESAPHLPSYLTAGAEQ